MSRNRHLTRLDQLLAELQAQGTLQQGDAKDLIDALRVLKSTNKRGQRDRALARINRWFSRFVKQMDQ